MIKIFFDTEFIDTGKEVHLLSIGLVREDNATYYAEPAETDRSLSEEWVQKNVLPYMKGPVKPRAVIAQEIVEFAGFRPQFWAYFGAYDWLCLCQLYGRMLDVPVKEQWPHYVMDVQVMRTLIHPQMPLPKHTGNHHNALDDAIWTKHCYEYLMNYLRSAQQT